MTVWTGLKGMMNTAFVSSKDVMIRGLEHRVPNWISPGPELPLKISGSFQTIGWDGDIYYAIDASDQIWMSDGHGIDLYKADANHLLSELLDETLKFELAEILGLPIVECKCQKCDGTGVSKTIDLSGV